MKPLCGLRFPRRIEQLELRDNDVPHTVIVYLEGQVQVDVNTAGGADVDRIVDQTWLGRLHTRATVDLRRSATPLEDPALPPSIFYRGNAARRMEADSAVALAAYHPTSPQVDGNSFATQSNDPLRWSEETVMQTPVDSFDSRMVINPQTGQLQSLDTPSVPRGFQPAPLPTSPAEPSANSFPQPAGPGAVEINSPFQIDVNARDANIAPLVKSYLNPDNPNERITVFIGGARISVNSLELAQLNPGQSGQLFVSADSIVHWKLALPNGTERNQFYMEGNVEFAQGQRVIFADRMFYDVETQQGTILKAEVVTPIKNFDGAVRLKADVVQQLNENNLQAYGAAFTTSRLGVPRYWAQSESLAINRVAGTGDGLVFDPNAGVAGSLVPNESDDQFYVDSQQNRVYVAGVPMFIWPRLRTSLNDPSYYLEEFGINNDRIFGFQVTTGWNLYQILGRQQPAGSNWIGSLDYLSDRGLGFGTEYTYQRDALFGIPGRVRGRYDSWFINDDGLDFLGRDRRDLVPEEEFRGRTVLKHRHDFSPGYQLRAEVGYITDRNFLEQYYEREWDTAKDATTGFWLERNVNGSSFNLTGDLQLNDFFTQTSGIKFDQFTLGRPVFNHRAIWHSHSHVGYLRLRQADAPTNAVDAAKFDPLAWETDVDGIRAGTRQEFDVPLQFGPVKVVPYALGDATYWQEARDGNDLFRAYGQTGVRASLPMWRIDPSIRSVLWNVNGLAHKVSFDLDAFYADASQDLDELALYDPLDDDAQEHFRRRFAFDTFGILPGGDTPLRYDERYFALRSGMQGNVTGASTEIADDLSAIKFGVSQRWQTKRGVPGREHIIDWITFDVQATLFPNANRDNFGSDFGMFDYDFRWYVGDRLSLVSDGYFDFFSQGLRTASFGANLSRPEIGNAYLGYRMIEGPISSNILSAAVSYRMSDKWGVKGGGQVDFGETGSIGQTLSLIYIGESFLWQFGFNYDFSRENFGFRFGLEPRFTRRPRLFRPGGTAIPAAGARWLE